MIEINNISKSYRKESVLNNCNADIHTDKITAVVAPNGSGKSTMIKLIIRALFPDSGTIAFNENSRKMAYLSEEEEYPKYFTVNEILGYEAVLHQLSTKQIWNHPAVTAFELEKFKNKRCKNLSKGMYQKLALAKALLSNPDLLILDEPFNGLDAISRDMLIQLLIDRRKQAKGTLLSSHILYEMEDFCDFVLFMTDQSISLVLSFIDEAYVVVETDPENEINPLLAGQCIYSRGNKFLVKEELSKELKLSGMSNVKIRTDNIVNDIYKTIYGTIL